MEKKKTIKEIILENTEEKSFGCIHCRPDTELVITDMTNLVAEINKASVKSKRDIAIQIVNFINKEYGLNLYTVDSSAMTDDIYSILDSNTISKEN